MTENIHINRLKKYLQDKDIFLDEEELETVMHYSICQHKYNANLGYFYDRLKDNPREKAFHDQWLYENEGTQNSNLLNTIFTKPSVDRFSRSENIVNITNNDRRMVATIIQWLGSNVGMGFLRSTLQRCGYDIIQIKSDKET